MSIREASQSALYHYRQGDLNRAFFFCRKILEEQPDNAQILNLAGLIQAQCGEYEASKRFFEKAIQSAPDNAEFYNNMGDLLFTIKQFDNSVVYYKRALQLNPDFALGYFNLGLALQEKGQTDKAAAEYRKALQRDQNLYQAHYNLGVIFSGKGNIDKAIAHYQNALRINPNIAEIYYNLGNAYSTKGRLDDAVAYYQKALKINPEFTSALNNLGLAFQEQGKFDDALIQFKKVLQLHPGSINANNNIGNILSVKGQYDDAIMYYQEAIKIDRNRPDSFNSLGTAYKGKRLIDHAIACYQKAVQLNADFPEAYFNLGNAFKDKGEFDKAILNYHKAVQLRPSFAKAYNGLGNVFHEKGQLDEAESYYKRAIQMEPDNAISYQALLFSMIGNPGHDAQAVFSEHLLFAAKFAEPLSLFISPHMNECIPNRKLKIGYVSPDFRRHSVSYFVEPLLTFHNREQFEVFCYSNHFFQDEVTERIRSKSAQWRNIAGMSDENAAEMIRKDTIDILVDLSGHTANNRILLFARKPAPVQISWLGYPATTGLSSIDYRIVDAYTDPVGMADRLSSEELIRAPGCFLCYLPDKDSPGVNTLPALSAGHITFGSLNNFSKVSPDMIAAWTKILRKIPDARLILKARNFTDDTTREEALSRFIREGIADDRIELLTWKPSTREHLETYCRIDIGLDTFPYNGTTTTCEALWMGVPVMTLTGNTHVSRVGMSLLSNTGLTECIAHTLEEYVGAAVKLAGNMPKLHALRSKLREMVANSPLTDAKRFADDMETCYRTIWEKWCTSANLQGKNEARRTKR